MKINVRLSTARYIYLATLLIVIAIGYGLYRGISGPESTETVEVQRGSITVDVVETTISTNTPPHIAQDIDSVTTTQPHESSEFGWWTSIKQYAAILVAYAWRIIAILALIAVMLFAIESGYHRFLAKKSPMPELKDYKVCKLTIKAWNVCRPKSSGNAGSSQTSPSPKKEDKDKKGFWAQVWSGLVIIFKFGKKLLIFGIIGLVIFMSNPRYFVAQSNIVYWSITGKTSDWAEKLLRETAPAIDKMSEEEKEKLHILPQQEAWRMERILSPNEGITGSRPAPWVARYVMSDQIAFEVELFEAGSNERMRLVLYHDHRDDLHGWWERIGGKPITRPGDKPTWFATMGADGSYIIQSRDSESQIFHPYRIYKLRKP